MVDFAVFNELSLPLNSEIEAENNFKFFFKLLRELKNRDLNTIRMDKDFKNYEILPNITFYHFFNQLNNRELKDRLREFRANSVIEIDSPLIKDDEIKDNEQAIEEKYYYNNKSTFGGLACADIWNTIAISFNSKEEWNRDIIILKKEDENINIKHSSSITHLNSHIKFFEELREEIKLNITKENFWERRKEFFPKKIIFCKEVEKQVQNLDKLIFQQAISILRDIESNKKLIIDYNISGEGKTVKDNNKKLKKIREFTINNKKVFFEKHIKNLSNGNRIYFLEKDKNFYIGYIGKHLANKNDK